MMTPRERPVRGTDLRARRPWVHLQDRIGVESLGHQRDDAGRSGGSRPEVVVRIADRGLASVPPSASRFAMAGLAQGIRGR